jgi:hypothetical protein
MRHLLISLAASLLLVTLTGSIHAAPQATATLSPSDDAYVDIARPAANLDGGGLNVALSNNPEPPPPATITKRVFLKFSLAGVSFSIAQARLSLSALSDTACGGAPSAVNVAILAVDDDAWTETGLTWNNQPTAGAQLDTLDGGAVGGSGYQYWTDTGSDGFATWLRSQQAANGGDNVASLALVITGTTATTSVIFEDREGIGGSLGCAGGGLLPALKVADAGTPLAVALESFTAVAASRFVYLQWATVTELRNLGFNLYRAAAPDGPWLPLNAALIPSQAPGSSEGRTYTWEDREVSQPGVYLYRLETVHLDGARANVETISVTFPPPARLWLPILVR